MLAGDLETFPLSDLLQWADDARRSGILTIERNGLPTWMHLRQREVVAVSAPPGLPFGVDEKASVVAAAAAPDRLLDLFLERHGRFHMQDAEEEPEPGIPVSIALRVLVMEGLRHLDELPKLQASFPDDSARLGATREPVPRDLSAMAQHVLACARERLSLGEARLRLGVSRPALLRRMHELASLGLLSVEGSDGRVDPVSRLIAQAAILVRERQFEEAAIVFSTLLAADPSDVRLRRMLQDAEREQVASLYTELHPLGVPRLSDPGALRTRRLTRTEREVAERINGRWDVSSLVLSSPLREVETLKSLRRLVRLGVVAFERAPV